MYIMKQLYKCKEERLEYTGREADEKRSWAEDQMRREAR